MDVINTWLWPGDRGIHQIRKPFQRFVMQIPSRMVLSEKCREEGKPLKRFTSRHRWLTPGLRDCVEMRFAAMPPDVRKAVPFRLELMESGAMPQLRGVAPE